LSVSVNFGSQNLSSGINPRSSSFDNLLLQELLFDDLILLGSLWSSFKLLLENCNFAFSLRNFSDNSFAYSSYRSSVSSSDDCSSDDWFSLDSLSFSDDVLNFR
jgi:hypothetical protein